MIHIGRRVFINRNIGIRTAVTFYVKVVDKSMNIEFMKGRTAEYYFWKWANLTKSKAVVEYYDGLGLLVEKVNGKPLSLEEVRGRKQNTFKVNEKRSTSGLSVYEVKDGDYLEL